MWYLKLSAVLGYPVAVLLGLPLYFVYRHYRRTSFIVYIATGLALGCVPWLASIIPSLVVAVVTPGYHFAESGNLYAAKGILLTFPVSALCGAIASASFWLIVRPDRVSNKQLNGA